MNERTISKLRARVVAGAANNQLATPEDGQRLAGREILYAPDYVINACGVISTALEGPSFEHSKLLARVAGISDTLRDIFMGARSKGQPTHVVAERMAKERLAQACARRGMGVRRLVGTTR